MAIRRLSNLMDPTEYGRSKDDWDNFLKDNDLFEVSLSGVIIDDGYGSSKITFNELCEAIKNKIIVESEAINPIPLGTIFYTSRITAPTNYLFADGSIYSRDNYPEFYDLLTLGEIETITFNEWNSINDSYNNVAKFGLDTNTSQFKMIKLTDSYIQNTISSPGSNVLAGLPNIKGRLMGLSHDSDTSKYNMNGCFSWDSSFGKYDGAGRGSNDYPAKFDASKSNGIYGRSTTVIPPSVRLRVIVCVK